MKVKKCLDQQGIRQVNPEQMILGLMQGSVGESVYILFTLDQSMVDFFEEKIKKIGGQPVVVRFFQRRANIYAFVFREK